MTRFESEISGQLGEFWVKEAQKKIEKIENDIESGQCILENGTAKWKSNGRYIPKDCLEYVLHSKYASQIDVDVHNTALSDQNSKCIEDYRKKMENHVYTEEELGEMRNAFGEGKVIVDVITGRKIKL